ncbi:OLC1v1019795C4 [Oldenlandia corymbosa var. corymbosa]|uniref:OLC1v1019795C4 n=1 Tax=Oldenlandia corymbosa var. corymbosa TaxID=529605 RepID=A0AAV1EEZ2_OLDCO|nr:OLC1v1019795C4 [Oldenlandia corymbosa var. corymbosa]
MSYRRDQRSSRASLFDDIEEGGLRTSSRDIDERDNDKAIDSLHDRVSYLKRLTGDIHEEVESHNRILSQIVRNCLVKLSLSSKVLSYGVH